MTSPKWLLPAVLCCFVLSLCGATNTGGSSRAQFSPRTSLPLTFERNEGQADSAVKFLGRAPGYTVFFTSSSALLVVPLPDKQGLATIGFVPVGPGRMSRRRVVGEHQLPTRSNYLRRRHSAADIRGIPSYARVHYENVAPGVVFEYYSRNGRLEYDIAAAPRSHLRDIAVKILGASNISVDHNGDLVVQTPAGQFLQHKPLAYQQVGSTRVLIPARYRLLSGNKVGFSLAPYNHDKQLVIDPVLTYSTYIGGSTQTSDGVSSAATSLGSGIGIDASNNVYVSGFTTAVDFPITPGAYDSTISQPCTRSNGCYSADEFIAKFSPSGKLLYSTFLGPGVGDGNFQPHSDPPLAVDAVGNAYIASTGLPCDDCFQSEVSIEKLDPTGSRLLYSYQYNLEGDASANAVAVDSAAHLYVAGNWNQDAGPASPPGSQIGSATNCYILKLDTTKSGSSSVDYTTLIGVAGSTGTGISGIAIDNSGHAYVAGPTDSPNFPHTTQYGTGSNSFVMKLNTSGSSYLYSVIVGGAITNAIAVDQSGNAYLTGQGLRSGFPTTSNASQSSFGGGTSDAFLLKLSSTGGLAYATYIGGGGEESGTAVAVRYGYPAISGSTNSTNFPVTANAFQRTNAGTWNAFIDFRHNDSNLTRFYSTLLGGNKQDWSTGVALDTGLNAYVTGSATSDRFPVTSNAYQATLRGAQDAFLSKIVIAGDLAMKLTQSSSSVAQGSNLTYTARVSNNGPDTSSGLVLKDVLPSRSTFVSYTITAGSCSHPAVGSTGTVACSLNSLPKGALWTLTLTSTVHSAKGSSITDTAQVSAKTQDLSPGNNKASATTAVF